MVAADGYAAAIQITEEPMKRPLVVLVPVVAALAAGLTAGRLLADDASPAPAAPAPPAAADKAREEKVRTLLKLQATAEIAKAKFDSAIEQSRSNPRLPAGFVDKMHEKVTVQDFTDLSIPPYLKHVDDATLDAAIAFFGSPEGKKFVAQLPAILSDLEAAGAALGRQKAQEVVKELQAGRK